MLHDSGEEQLLPVVDGINVDLDRVIEKAVDEHRMLRVDLRGTDKVIGEHRVVVHDLHATTAEDETRSHEHRIPDILGNRLRLWKGGRGPMLWRRQARCRQDLAEGAPLLRKVNRLGARPEDGHARILE